ncbi:MAG: hypothetical protein WC700_20785 [Gemmatimonadaceae bacterium]|jgi:hypothetical protein
MFDQDRFARLRSAAVFCAEYHRGTIADTTHPARVMSFVGGTSWSQINGLPCISQAAVLDGTSSAAEPRIVDVTGAFSVEWCGRLDLAIAASTTLLAQVGPASGGFSLSWDSVNTVYVLALYDNAGAVARSITTPATSAVVGPVTHLVMTSSAGGTVGTAMLHGVPVAAALGGAGVAANINADGAIIAGGGASGNATSVLARAYPSALGREDQTALAAACKSLAGEV